MDLIERVRKATDVAVEATGVGDGRWAVTIAAADQAGVLAIIAGVMAGYGLDIVSGDITTVRREGVATASPRRRFPPRGPVSAAPPKKCILDVFEVMSPEVEPDWGAFESELRELVGLLVEGQREEAADRVAARVTDALREPRGALEGQLFPVSIEVTNEPESPYTEVSIRSVDTPGFLFAFTNALAGVTVTVERAQVRTVEGEVQDTFWVTDLSGRKIEDEQRVHELRVATALVKEFTHLLPRSPNPGQALRQFNAMVRQLVSRPEWTADLRDLGSPEVLQVLAELMGVSRFLWEDFLRMQHENLFPVVRDAPALEAGKSREELAKELRARLSGLRALRGPQGPATAATDALNEFKDREMFRIDLRHITGRVSFEEFSRELTELAEVVIEAAGELSEEALGGKRGKWCILALGKFGGAELGFGSDLELLFTYEDEGHPEYWEEFVRGTVGALHARQEGIFQIDLRLRPYGRAGTLASPLEGLRAYYSEEGQAQQFERLALVKLRPVAGDTELGRGAVEIRDGFVYSGKPLDLENIRHLRRRQARELVPPGQVNAKYSAGGLVDVEYFVQARQIEGLIRETNTLEAIGRLGLSNEVGDAYVFLRRLIDALRVVRGNAKDLTIPTADTREFGYLAQRLHLGSAGELSGSIGRWMGFARGLWEG